MTRLPAAPPAMLPLRHALSWMVRAGALLGVCVALPAHAQIDTILADRSVYGGLSAQGLTLGAGIGIPGLPLGVRAEWAALPLPEIRRTGDPARNSLSLGVDDFDVNGRLRSRRLNLLGDFFPIPGWGLRLTAGLQFNTQRVTATATLLNPVRTHTYNSARGYTGTITFAGQPRVEATVQQPDVTPYVGIGLGHRPEVKGWGFYADIGISVGRHTGRVTPYLTAFDVQGDPRDPLGAGANAPEVRAEFQARLDAEVADLQRKLDDVLKDYPVYPQIAIGVTYRF